MERSGDGEGLGSEPSWDFEGAGGVGARRGRVHVVGAKNVLDHPAAHVMIYVHARFGIDEKPLAAYGAAYVRGYFGLPN